MRVVAHLACRVGRVAGCAVVIHWSAVLIVAVMAVFAAVGVLPAAAPGNPVVVYWLASGFAAVAFLASLVVHELAHVVVARRFGLRASSVTVTVLGGHTVLDDEPTDARADLAVALSGPLGSFVLAAVFVGSAVQAVLLGVPLVVTCTLIWVGVVNVLVGAFSALPAYPLDGGRALRAAVWWLRDDRVLAGRLTMWVSRVFGLTLLCFGIAQLAWWRQYAGGWLVLLGCFFVWATAPTLGVRRAASRIVRDRGPRVDATRD